MKRIFLLLLSIALLNTHSVARSENQSDSVPDSVAGVQLGGKDTQSLQLVTGEFQARFAEYRTGRSPVNVLLRCNQRLLRASLASSIPDAAIAYDGRAREIELLANINLERGTGTLQDVAQAEGARLDAILKRAETNYFPN